MRTYKNLIKTAVLAVVMGMMFTGCFDLDVYTPYDKTYSNNFLNKSIDAVENRVNISYVPQVQFKKSESAGLGGVTTINKYIESNIPHMIAKDVLSQYFKNVTYSSQNSDFLNIEILLDEKYDFKFDYKNVVEFGLNIRATKNGTMILNKKYEEKSIAPTNLNQLNPFNGSDTLTKKIFLIVNENLHEAIFNTIQNKFIPDLLAALEKEKI